MYKKSKDYEKLWELINQGHRIAGWAKDRDRNLSIVEIKLKGFIGCSGYAFSLYAGNFDAFDIACKSCQLEYILPHE